VERREWSRPACSSSAGRSPAVLATSLFLRLRTAGPAAT